jgi:hypothetical protein
MVRGNRSPPAFLSGSPCGTRVVRHRLTGFSIHRKMDSEERDLQKVSLPKQEIENKKIQNKKREQGAGPALEIVSTLFPRKFDLILIDGLAPLVRAWAPPETWTTRLNLRPA